MTYCIYVLDKHPEISHSPAAAFAHVSAELEYCSWSKRFFTYCCMFNLQSTNCRLAYMSVSCMMHCVMHWHKTSATGLAIKKKNGRPLERFTDKQKKTQKLVQQRLESHGSKGSAPETIHLQSSLDSLRCKNNRAITHSAFKYEGSTISRFARRGENAKGDLNFGVTSDFFSSGN